MCIMCVSSRRLDRTILIEHMTIKKYIQLFALPCCSSGKVERFFTISVASTHSHVITAPCTCKKDYKKRQQCATIATHTEFQLHIHCCPEKSSQCSNNMSFPNFLKTYNPSLYKQYHLEREVAGTTGKSQHCSYFG